MGGDLAELKKNLAKFKKGKHGKGLDDIDIEELDFVSNLCQTLALEKISESSFYPPYKDIKISTNKLKQNKDNPGLVVSGAMNFLFRVQIKVLN